MMKFFKNTLTLLFVFGLAALLPACDDTNDWPVDPSYDALFRPLVFKASAKGTTAEITFTKVINADKYVLEFSEGELEFGEIVRTEIVMADTLTAYSDSPTATKVEYRLWLTEFNGDTGYSVRMKAFDEDSGLETQYVEDTFKTDPENIFTSIERTTESVTLQWTPTDKVTRLVIEKTSGSVIVYDQAITAAQKEAAEATVSGLEMGTYYKAVIYNEEYIRGQQVFKTTGSAGSHLHQVQADDDLEVVLEELVAASKNNITLVFTEGVTYELGTLTVPAGISELAFTSAGNPAWVDIAQLKLSEPLGELSFETINLRGEGPGGKRFIDSGIGISIVAFEDCMIDGYNSVVRFTNSEMIVDSISVNNCRVSNTGGYGVFNVGGNRVRLRKLHVSNSTFTEMATQLTDVRTDVESVVLTNCTFYNKGVTMTQLFRFDTSNKPLEVFTKACIFAGPNNGGKVNATNADYGTLVTFGGSYKTSDLIENTRKFLEIDTYSGTSEELFADPENGDFRIREGAGFSGAGSAGDPRWY